MVKLLQILAGTFMETFFTAHQNQGISEAEQKEAAQKEAERLRALERYAILDTMPEPAYDDIVMLAAQIFQVPVAMISFTDHDRQWFKASIGVPVSQVPREHAFCARVMADPPDILLIPDASQDQAFADNIFVRGEPHIRFYASTPLLTSEGQVLGALCVFGFEPYQASEQQLQALRALARQVISHLELRLKVRQLEETWQQFRAFTDNTPMLAYIKNENGYYEYVNAPFLQHFNFSRAQVIGKHDSELWDAAIIERVRALEKQVFATGETAKTLEIVRKADGTEVFWRIYKFPLFWKEQRAIGSIAVDVSESKHYEHELEAMRANLEASNAILRALSTTDELTNIHNRRSFTERLHVEWERAARLNTPLSLLMIDVDLFKAYNDSFGHVAGDAILQQVAGLLCETARSIDVVARYGGEEFTVILPDADQKGAHIFAERFRYAIEAANWPRRKLTVSIGVATRAPAIKNPSQLIDRADAALYRAKQNGRNRVEIAP